jgi:hypothetical protein
VNHNYDPTDLSGQDLIREAEAKRKRVTEEQAIKDFRWLMGTQQGRRIVWRLLDQSGVFRLSFDGNALKMAFNEGNRNFGNQILAQIHRDCPELYSTMTKEQVNGSDGNGGN